MSTCVAALYAAAGGAPATTPAQDLVDTWASGGAGSDGFAMVFEDAGGTDAPSIYIKDSGTPANDTDINLTDDFDAFNSFLTYTSPSPKIVRQSDGNLKYCAHNIFDVSEDFSDAAWTKSGVTITSDAATTPDGTGADAIVYALGTACRVQDTIAVTTGKQYAVRITAKAGTKSILRATIDFTETVWFNLGTGAVGSSGGSGVGSIVDLGSGFYECTVVFTAPDSSVVTYFQIVDADSGTSLSGASVSDELAYIAKAHFFHYPADETYLPTTTAARFALPIQHDSSNNAEGLLVEPASTNLLTYSNDFSTWSQSDAGGFTLTANDATGPDGQTSMTKLEITDATNERHRLFLNYTGSTSTITHSIYVKPGTLRYVGIRSTCNLAWGVAVYDLTALTVTDTQTGSSGETITIEATGIQNVGGGFYRLYMTTTATSATGHNFLLQAHSTGTPSLDASVGSETFAGTAGQYIHIFGAQVELGSVPTSPIITTGATATRAVDDLNKALTAIEHSATAGTLYAKYVPRGVATSRDIVRLDDGTANEVISIGQTSGAAARLTVTDGGAAQTAPLTSGTVVAAADNKVAASWAANDFAISEGGAAASTDTSGTLPTVTTFDVGAVNGLVKEVLHLPEAMSDGDLASITT